MAHQQSCSLKNYWRMGWVSIHQQSSIFRGLIKALAPKPMDTSPLLRNSWVWNWRKTIWGRCGEEVSWSGTMPESHVTTIFLYVKTVAHSSFCPFYFIFNAGSFFFTWTITYQAILSVRAPHSNLQVWGISLRAKLPCRLQKGP